MLFCKKETKRTKQISDQLDRKSVSNPKGIAGLYGLGLIFVLSLLLLGGLVLYVNLIASDIKIKVDVEIKVDDSGSWITSFLNTKKGDKTYMEIIGDMETEENQKFIQQDIENVKASFNKQNLGEGITSIATNKLVIGEKGKEDDRFLIDMPVPGGGKKDLEIYHYPKI